MDNEVSLKLYSPLTADWIPDDAESGWDEPAFYDDPEQLTGSALVPYRDAIEAALADDMDHTESGVALFKYRDGRVCEKVKSIDVTVCCRNGELMGCTTVRLDRNLTETEMRDLQSYLSGQMSDGWGESFEQRKIRMDGGTIYVHFWQEDDFSFEIGSADRLRIQTGPKKPVLPHINLAGPDGNIYAVLGKAGQALRKAGQGEKVSEMNRRVYASGSYGEALGIVSEYVQTDFPQAQARPRPSPDRGDGR